MPNDLVIDLETLDTRKSAIVLSAGLIVFDRDTLEKRDERYWEFSIISQIAEGRTLSRETQEWWIRENQCELDRLMRSGTRYIRRLIQDLLVYPRSTRVWSRGCMDFHIIQDLTDSHFYYNSHRDCRTLDSLGFHMEHKNNHHALEDVRNEWEQVRKAMEVARNATV